MAYVYILSILELWWSYCTSPTLLVNTHNSLLSESSYSLIDLFPNLSFWPSPFPSPQGGFWSICNRVNECFTGKKFRWPKFVSLIQHYCSMFSLYFTLCSGLWTKLWYAWIFNQMTDIWKMIWSVLIAYGEGRHVTSKSFSLMTTHFMKLLHTALHRSSTN